MHQSRLQYLPSDDPPHRVKVREYSLGPMSAHVGSFDNCFYACATTFPFHDDDSINCEDFVSRSYRCRNSTGDQRSSQQKPTGKPRPATTGPCRPLQINCRTCHQPDTKYGQHRAAYERIYRHDRRSFCVSSPRNSFLPVSGRDSSSKIPSATFSVP